MVRRKKMDIDKVKREVHWRAQQNIIKESGTIGLLVCYRCTVLGKRIGMKIRQREWKQSDMMR